jgi:cell division protein ZapA
MSQEKHSVLVKIYGTEYNINAEEDPEYIQKIAEYVDERMQAISRETTNSLAGVAILTAMDIAHELHAEREGKVLDVSASEGRITDLIRRLDQVLEKPME